MRAEKNTRTLHNTSSFEPLFFAGHHSFPLSRASAVAQVIIMSSNTTEAALIKSNKKRKSEKTEKVKVEKEEAPAKNGKKGRKENSQQQVEEKHQVLFWETMFRMKRLLEERSSGNLNFAS